MKILEEIASRQPQDELKGFLSPSQNYVCSLPKYFQFFRIYELPDGSYYPTGKSLLVDMLLQFLGLFLSFAVLSYPACKFYDKDHLLTPYLWSSQQCLFPPELVDTVITITIANITFTVEPLEPFWGYTALLPLTWQPNLQTALILGSFWQKLGF